MYYTHLHGEIRKSTILLYMVFAGSTSEKIKQVIVNVIDYTHHFK